MIHMLKPRLALVAKKVPECRILYDIGSDHACLPVSLVSENVCEYAYATDTKDGPLAAAKRNIAASGLENWISVIKGDGLDPVMGDDTDSCAVISGLGGLLIARIVTVGASRARSLKKLILQPMNYYGYLRMALTYAGFVIDDEELVLEGKKTYLVITAESGTPEKYRPVECFYTPEILYKRRDPLLPLFLSMELAVVNKAINGLNASISDHSQEILKRGQFRGLTITDLLMIRSIMMEMTDRGGNKPWL